MPILSSRFVVGTKRSSFVRLWSQAQYERETRVLLSLHPSSSLFSSSRDCVFWSLCLVLLSSHPSTRSRRLLLLLPSRVLSCLWLRRRLSRVARPTVAPLFLSPISSRLSLSLSRKSRCVSRGFPSLHSSDTCAEMHTTARVQSHRRDCISESRLSHSHAREQQQQRSQARERMPRGTAAAERSERDAASEGVRQRKCEESKNKESSCRAKSRSTQTERKREKQQDRTE